MRPGTANEAQRVPGPAGRPRPGRIGRSAFGIVLLPFLLAACVTEEREQQIGDAMAASVNPQLPIVDDPLLNAYVYAVGRRIAKASSRPDLDYRFYLVDTPEVNAFALPGGHIYLTRGLIERTRDGNEFAGILAHEIGHVAARHGVQKIQRQLRTGSLVNLLYNTILGGEPQLLRENPLQLANVVWSARHSRRDEREADRLAVEYLRRSGIDPAGVVSLLETLALEEEARGAATQPVDWFSTHPLTSSRLDEVRAMIRDGDRRTPMRLHPELKAFPAFKQLITEGGPYEAVERGW